MWLVFTYKHKCLHCGNGTAKYCEECYQDLIAKNAKLQFERDMAIKYNRALEQQKALKQKYIEDLEHIRNCYYKELAERIEEKKIFKTNNKPKELTKYQIWECDKEIEKNHIPSID